MPGQRPAPASEPIGLPAASAGQLRSARRLSRRKDRQSAGRFLVEGPQAVREALAGPVDLVLITAEAAERHADLVTLAGERAVEVVLVDDLAGLAEAVTPQGIVAVAHTVDVDLATALAGAPELVVICAQVRDPGNAGTVIRCADAFGADAVILTEGSVDPYNAKTVRATVGSLFHLPIVTGVSLGDAVRACHDRGLLVLAADGAGDTDLDQLQRAGDLARPIAWLMGNEAWGLPSADAALADRRVNVPMWGSAESLNLSTAAAVCLYTTAAAQRR
ncbi:MAG: RNA methyltransferase [Propionibacteriales bacterium]|nr:RNA methyltransferase [Propionibacteriales bacterium]